MVIAILISLFWHIFCFNNIELIFAQKSAGQDSTLNQISFLGPILKQSDYYSPPIKKASYSRGRFSAADILTPLEINALIRKGFLADLRAETFSFYQPNAHSLKLKKPVSCNLNNEKVIYLDYFPMPETKQATSSIMFYPPMPYHFLLYFKDRQTAHVEIAFYVSPEGKVVGIKRKISSGNPEVDLLIMRNLTHFLNLCKSNLILGSWQTVKIDLMP